MASAGKKKTTMAKLNREARLRERRLDKAARKDARRQAAAEGPGEPADTLTAVSDEDAETGAEHSDPDGVDPAPDRDGA